MKKITQHPYYLKARKHVTKKRVAVFSVAAAALLILIPVITYARFANDISDRERLMNRKSTGIVLRDKGGQVFYEYGKIDGNDDIPLSQISDEFEKTLVASEDQTFWTHEGYSVKAIASAATANVLNKDATRYGGSTITQQLVKNKLLSSDKSFLRKYQELSMAVAIERKYSKEEILEMYVNSVYYGEGAFGITDAAKVYFNKSAQDLTLAESSMLVALLPAPSTYSPTTGDAAKGKEQQAIVLERMSTNGFITKEEGDAAAAQQLAYVPASNNPQEQAPHFAAMVIDQLKEKYGEETVTRLGYDVTTTLDLNWQKQAEANVRERVAALTSVGARNAGLVAIDPKNGQVRALVGSVDWNNPTFGKVNMATSARQPGSSYKPIYYTEAIDKRLVTAATIMKDEPKTYGGNYKPTNYDFKYRGDIPVRNALAQSLNIPAVDVMQKLGPDEAAAASKRMGITTVTEPEKYGLSLGLGTAETKLTEMVNAYAAFANGGGQFEQTMVTGIKDKYGDEVYKYKQTSARKVMSPEASFITSSMLSDNQARAPTFGNNLTLGNNRKVAVKTGTTNDSKDAWTIGYTPSVVVGVWMGNNENQPMQGLAGSSSAGGVWRNTMSNYLGNTPAEDFKKPDKVTSLRVCKGSGLRAAREGGNTYEEFFIQGTEPKEECNQKQEPEERQDRDEEEEEEENEEPENRREERERNRENSEEEGGNNGGEGNGNQEGGRGGNQPNAPGTPATTTPAPPAEPDSD